MTTITTRSTIRIGAWGAVGCLLLVPLVAMQFTREVDWTASDFVFAGVVLGGTGGLFELALRQSGSIGYRIAAGLALLGCLMLVWVNGAVGVIGSENNPANLMYGAVLAIALLGTALARFRAQGMAATLFAMAGAIVAIGAIAVGWNLGPDGPIWPRDVIGLTGIFTVIFALSALLFRSAARDA
jgi:hypothetical protein